MRESDIARVTADAWRAVLEIEGDAGDEDFFQLGGDSLAAVTLVDRLRADLGVEVPLEVVFFDGRLSALIRACADLVAAAPDPRAHVQR